MKAQMMYKFSAKAFILVSALSLAYVAILALWSPQAVMDLVQVTLPNNDALSSIRGVYGGVGLTIVVSLLTMGLKQIQPAMLFLSLFWGSYALSRLVTIVMDGGLGYFGTTWIYIESFFCIIGVVLAVIGRKQFKEKVS